MKMPISPPLARSPALLGSASVPIVGLTVCVCGYGSGEYKGARRRKTCPRYLEEKEGGKKRGTWWGDGGGRWDVILGLPTCHAPTGATAPGLCTNEKGDDVSRDGDC